MAAMWTRIWCVRPLWRASSSRVAGPVVAVAGRRSPHGVGRAGRLAGRGDGHLRRGAGRAADGRLDLPPVVGHRALDQGQVAALHGAGGELFDEGAVGLGRAGHGEEPRGALVEPVHDAGTVRRAHALGHEERQVGEARQETADQGALGVTGPGMDDEPGRLVDDGDLGVGVDDLEDDTRLGRQGGAPGGRTWTVSSAPSLSSSLPCSAGVPSTSTRPGADQLGRSGAGDVGQHGHGAIESHAGHEGGHVRGDDVTPVGAIAVAAGRHDRSASEVVGAAGTAARRAPVRRGRPKSRQAITMMMPTVTQASARLKVGQ